MTEAEWENGSDAAGMLAWLESRAMPPRRKRKLLLCAAARRLFGDRQAVGPILDKVETWANALVGEPRGAIGPRTDVYGALFGLPEPNKREQAAVGLLALATMSEKGLWAMAAQDACEPAELAETLRELFGNPMRRTRRIRSGLHHRVRAWPAGKRPAELLFVRDWAEWQAGLPTKLAQGIEATRAWDEMPILGDALEEAGCDEPALLEHLRKPGPHARGCWALDLVLDRE